MLNLSGGGGSRTPGGDAANRSLAPAFNRPHHQRLPPAIGGELILRIAMEAACTFSVVVCRATVKASYGSVALSFSGFLEPVSKLACSLWRGARGGPTQEL